MIQNNTNKRNITINEAAKILGVSLDTLRRWDKAGKLRSFRFTPAGHRHYDLDDIEMLSKNIFSLARTWSASKNPKEPEKKIYCQNISIFQARHKKIENELMALGGLENNFSLISAIVSEIGNNSFDHNIGSWLDICGIFFAYDINKRQIALADRGQGILTTLKRVRPNLENDEQALRVAFTEKISGRSPESRGNGLKFVRKIITGKQTGLDIKLYFQTGNAALNLVSGNSDLDILKQGDYMQGCLALINF